MSDYPIFEEGTERSFTTGRTAAEQEAWVASQEPDVVKPYRPGPSWLDPENGYEGPEPEETTVRRFELHRQTDVSGISGTGVVAEGVQFSDGTSVLRWLTDTASTAVYDSLTAIDAIHGHNGSTEFVFLDV